MPLILSIIQKRSKISRGLDRRATKYSLFYCESHKSTKKTFMKSSEEIKNDLKDLETKIVNLCNNFTAKHGQPPNITSQIIEPQIGFGKSTEKIDFKINAELSIKNK